MVTVDEARKRRDLQRLKFEEAKQKLIQRDKELAAKGIRFTRDKKADPKYRALDREFRLQKLRLSRLKGQVSRARGELPPLERRALKKQQVVTVKKKPILVQRGEVLKRKKPQPVMRKELIKTKAVIGAPIKETPGTKIRKFLTPKKTDSKPVRALKGGGVFVTDIITGLPTLLSDATRAGLGNKQKQAVLKETFNNQTISNIGREMGRQAASSDPFDKTQAILNILTVGAIPTKSPAVFSRVVSTTKKQIGRVNKFETNNVRITQTEIKKLKDKGVNTRERTPEGNKLRKLEELKKVQENTADLTKKLQKEVDKIDKKPNPSKSDVKKISQIIKADKPKRKKNNRKIKLNQATIAKGLKKVTEKPTKPTIKVKKGLPVTTKDLNKALLEARTVSGAQFKRLKNKIKKQTGLNVVQRGAGKDISFKLLEPKQQKKKGVKTASPRLFEITKEGKIVRKKTVKVEVTKKVTKKDLKDIEFKKGQDLDKLEKDVRRLSKQGFFKNKKAQSRMFTNYNKHVSNNKIKNNTVKTNQKQLARKTQQYNKRVKDPITSKKELQSLRKQKVTLTKSKTKLKVEVSQQIRKTQKIAKLSKTLAAIGIISKTASAQAVAQLPSLAQTQKLVNAFDFPTPVIPKKPTPGKGNGKKTPPNKVIPKKKTPIPPKTPKRVIKKPKVVKRPPKKPALLPIPKLTFNSKLPTGQKLAFDVFYKQKGKIKRLNTKLPLNKALRRAKNLIDNTLTRGMELRIVGTTKAKDLSGKQSLQKFRTRKTNKTLRLVEKAKNTFDTRGEIKGATIAKKLKKKRSK